MASVLVTQLKRLRLERDLSYRAMAEEVGVPLRTLHQVLTRPGIRPHERTLYKIKRYLDRRVA